MRLRLCWSCSASVRHASTGREVAMGEDAEGPGWGSAQGLNPLRSGFAAGCR